MRWRGVPISKLSNSKLRRAAEETYEALQQAQADRQQLEAFHGFTFISVAQGTLGLQLTALGCEAERRV